MAIAKPTRRLAHRPPASPTDDSLRAQLAAAQARYDALTARLPFVVYLSALSVQGAFTAMSPRVQELTGYPPEDWLKDRGLWLRRMHPDDRLAVLPMLVKAHRGGGDFRAEYRLIDRGGRAKWIVDESVTVRGDDGRALFIQGTWRETTERRRLESQVEGRDRALASTRGELEQFVSVASHEFKAPLRRIVNLGELLTRRLLPGLDAESSRALGEMCASAATMQALVAGLVEFAEADRGVPCREVDLDETLTRVLEDLKEAVAGSAATVTRGPLPKVWAEPEPLARVLRALLDNALKFRGDAAPRVHISCESSGSHWTVTVRDHGIGLHPRHAERVFGLFDRVRPGARPGLGLGLAVARKIVERAGGRIWVESEPGEGASFRFTMPCPAPEPR